MITDVRSTLSLLASAALLFCLLAFRPALSQSPPQAPDTMEARVAGCAPCHGARGEGTNNDYFPRLAGKPSGYLFNQLLAFREGRRRYPPMNYLLAFLTPDYLRKMAEFYADQRLPLQAVTLATAPAVAVAHGRNLVANGVPDRNVPACSACHGPKLTGMAPGIPGLVGLKPTYISAQLGAWRYGTRTAIAPDCMQIVASLLTEDEVASVSAWLASLPLPDDPSPLPVGALTTPLACGSEPQ
jgi:cytochrome c553